MWHAVMFIHSFLTVKEIILFLLDCVSINPLTPIISLVILLTVCLTVHAMLFGEFGTGSTNNPLIDIFLYSH